MSASCTAVVLYVAEFLCEYETPASSGTAREAWLESITGLEVQPCTPPGLSVSIPSEHLNSLGIHLQPVQRGRSRLVTLCSP